MIEQKKSSGLVWRSHMHPCSAQYLGLKSLYPVAYVAKAKAAARISVQLVLLFLNRLQQKEATFNHYYLTYGSENSRRWLGWLLNLC